MIGRRRRQNKAGVVTHRAELAVLRRAWQRFRAAVGWKLVRYRLHTTHDLPAGDHELRVAGFEDAKGELVARMKLHKGER